MEKSKLKYFKQIAVLFCIVLMMSLFSGMAQCKDSISEDGGKGLFAPVTEFADYFISERGQILSLTLEHLWMSLAAVLLAILLGVPVAILLTRHKKLSGPVLGIASLIQTIPSLALLGFMIPLLGIGWGPAVVALFLYALLPIIRNTYTGIENVDSAIIEAGRGMGLTGRQILYMVELPLAIPVVMAGIRTSTVINVGVATLCALVGAGGLGQLIFRGISMINSNMILAGAVPAALLALSLDYILGLCEHALSPEGLKGKQKFSKKSIVATGLIFIILTGIGYFLMRPAEVQLGRESKGKIVIGSKRFTEQYILGEMLSLMIENRTDIDVDRELGLGGVYILQSGMTTGDIDIYVEYTGTGYIVVLEKETSSDADEIYRVVKEEYKKKFNTRWLNPIGFNNTYAMIVTRDYAEKHDLKCISDLEKVKDDILAGFDNEFLVRRDGYGKLVETYGFQFKKQPKEMDPGLMYMAIKEGEVDAICGYVTDGRIPAFDLVCLEDDKHFFPPYYAVPLVKQETLDRYPELEGVIEELSGENF